MNEKKVALKDVTARGEAETRNRLYPVPTREGRDGRNLAFANQVFGTRYQTLMAKWLSNNCAGPVPKNASPKRLFISDLFEKTCGEEFMVLPSSHG